MDKITCATVQKDKLIKWYGWIFILVLCFTPIVFIFLPIMMINVNHFNKMLKSSRIDESQTIEGTLSRADWELINDNGLDAVKGNLLVLSDGGEVNCRYLRYVKKGEKIPDIEPGSNVVITGSYDDAGSLCIRTIKEERDEAVYTTEPSISVY